MEILLSPLPQVLIWKAEFSNFLFLFAAIERATLDVDAQQLEVMWLMMLQLEKGGNGKNPADFSECWIKHLLKYLNSSKIPLSYLFSTYYCYCGSLCVFAKGKNILFFFVPFFFETVGNVFWNQISHDKFQLQGVLHQFGQHSSVDRTDQPNVNGANGAVFNAQLTKSTP